MYAVSQRARRWPLAFTLALVGACSDETTSPTFSAPIRPNAAAGDVYLVTTPYDNGANGSLRWVLEQATARTFSASMMLNEGAFEPGSAAAEVHTLGAEPWITPASASGTVRLLRGR